MSALFEFVAAMLVVVAVGALLSAGVEVLLVGMVLVVLLVACRVVWWRWLGRFRAAHEGGVPGCCWACESMADNDMEDGPLTDEVMDPIADIFSGEVRPVNEVRSSPWARLDSAPTNRGRHFDERTRRSNEPLARWITEREQVDLGKRVVAEAEAILLFGQAIRDRDIESTGEIRRGDPGE